MPTEHLDFQNLSPLVKALLDQAQDIIYYLEIFPALKFLYVNEAVTHITGYTPQDHYDNPNLGFEIIHPDDHATLREIQRATGGLNSPIELRWVKKSGETIWTEQINSPVFDEAHQLVAIVGTARDITARKAAEEEVHRLRGYLPICAKCKRIRNDQGYWEEVEHYIQQHSEAVFTHGLCSSCLVNLLSDHGQDHITKV